MVFARIYTVNESAFKTSSQESDYWAGFIAADGNINKARRLLSINLAEKDIDHLKKLNSFLESSYKIFSGCVGEFSYSRLMITSKTICADLEINYNITPAKSNTLKFPTHLERDSQIHFLRGYFDGDGSVIYNKITNRLNVSLIGTHDFLSHVNILLKKYLNFECTIKRLKERREAHVILLGYAKAYRFLNFLYKGSDVYLLRKYNKYLEFTYVLNTRRWHKREMYLKNND